MGGMGEARRGSAGPGEAPEGAWHAVAVHARQEKAAAAALADRGLEVFLPTRIERRPWSDRVKKVELAFFPGYLFVRTALSAARRVEMLKVRQVYDLVGKIPGDDRIARAIPDWEIESLKTVVRSAREVDPVEGLVKGTPVVIGAGGLKGARGVVLQGPDGQRRLVVQVELLGRGVRTTLSAEDVLVGDEAAGTVRG